MKKYVFLLILLGHTLLFSKAQDTNLYTIIYAQPISDVIFYGGIHEFSDPVYIYPCGRIFKKTAFSIVAERADVEHFIPNSHKRWEKMFVSPQCYYIPRYNVSYDFLVWYMETNFKIKLPSLSIWEYDALFDKGTFHRIKSANYMDMSCKKYHVLYMAAHTFNARMYMLIDFDRKSDYDYTDKNQQFLNKNALYDGLFIKVLVPIIE